MRDFINDKLTQVHNDFLKEISRFKICCVLKDLRFNGGNIPDYNLEYMQQLYLLRYFPAYLIEYYDIYKNIINLSFIDRYSVLSIGSGCGIDYYALYFALNQNHDLICYTGVDSCDWNYRDSLGNHEYYFENIDINNWTKFDWDGYNVIIFPKSIGEFSNDTFNALLKAIEKSRFKSNRLILVSSLRSSRVDDDGERLTRIINVFENHHEYNCMDDKNNYIHYRQNVRLDEYFPQFHYPNHILESITSLIENCDTYSRNGEACKDDCQYINKWPILKTGLIKYQIKRLER